MKKREIKKIIKLNIESNIPQDAPKIDFPFAKYNSTSIKQRKWNLNFKYAMSASFAILIFVLAYAFWPGGETVPTPQPVFLSTDQEVISFSAISSVSLLSTLGTNELIGYTNTLEITQRPELIDRVMPYLQTVEQLLSSDSGLNIMTGPSDLPEYDTYMQFETKNLNGDTTVYTMHYNLVLLEEDDDESEYTIEGILLFKSNEYNVYGEKIVEEDEESITFKAYKDDSNYVESSYELENDKQVFEIKVIQNGITISESSYEIEYDDDEIDVKLSFIEGNQEGEFQFEFYTEGNKNLIKIEFEVEDTNRESSGEMIVQMITDTLTGNIKYLIYVDPDDEDPYEYETEDDEDDDEEDDDEEDDEDDEEDEEDDEDDEE